MKRTRRIRASIQTERRLVMSSNRSLYSLCSVCGDEVRMVTVDQAALLARVNAREIYREVEAGQLHFIETNEGRLLVCAASLNEWIAKQKE
jgi:hypothetical protein